MNLTGPKHVGPEIRQLIKSLTFENALTQAEQARVFDCAAGNCTLRYVNITPGNYPNTQGKIYLAGRQRILALFKGRSTTSVEQVARLMGVVVWYFWKYRTKLAEPITDAQLPLSVERAKRDYEEEPQLRDIVHKIELELTDAGMLLPKSDENRSPRRFREAIALAVKDLKNAFETLDARTTRDAAQASAFESTALHAMAELNKLEARQTAFEEQSTRQMSELLSLVKQLAEELKQTKERLMK